MKVPAALYRIDNLQRAWRWIRSNPDAGYKTYFRDHYSAYALAQDALLKDLSDRLRRGTYSPTPACKIFLPKASGILRPYTLLEVEDQIVYQSVANLVAEVIFNRLRHRYLNQVFGHLYAGKSSKWFYRKWSNGYSAFNKAAIKAYDAGNVFTASFDLTAFYDSIDHRVLRHFLQAFGLDRDLIHALCEWLSAWTGTDAQILQGHGIPQGPLSSGLLAEIVLSHLDDHRWTKARVVYLRYVDDVRLFARTEYLLRAALIRLDHLSKDIGLFPQSSKISIHHVSNIRTELKSVSQPVETVVNARTLDRKKVIRRLTALSPRYCISDKTRFNYVLSHALPSAALTARLWRILDSHPDMYVSVARYLARSRTLPRKTSQEVVRRIVGERLYPAISAAFLRATVGRLHPSQRLQARRKLKALWAPKSRSPDFTVALGRWLLTEGALTDRQIEYACSMTRSSWTRSSLILAVDATVAKTSVRTTVARNAVIDKSVDPAVCGAGIAGKEGFKPQVAASAMSRQAGLVLKEFGLVRRARGRICGINSTLSWLLENDVTFKWRTFFGKTYRQAERQLVGCRGYAGTDATAWVQGLDVFNDLLLDALFRTDSTLGRYTLGKIGSCTGSPSRVFNTKYPRVLTFVKEVHDARYQSFLAHPKIGKTQKATSRIPFEFIRKSTRMLRSAVNELRATGLI